MMYNVATLCHWYYDDVTSGKLLNRQGIKALQKLTDRMQSGRPEDGLQEKQHQKRNCKQQTVMRESYKTKDHKIKPNERKQPNMDLPHSEISSCTLVFEEQPDSVVMKVSFICYLMHNILCTEKYVVVIELGYFGDVKVLPERVHGFLWKTQKYQQLGSKQIQNSDLDTPAKGNSGIAQGESFQFIVNGKAMNQCVKKMKALPP